jgi:spore coat polysaccharide biosynthesis protein SpsF
MVFDLNEQHENKFTVVIQARISSRRLPGKVLLPFGVRTVLECLVDRLRTSRNVSQIVIATSDEQSDDQLADFVAQKKLGEVFRGSLQNVFSRFQKIALGVQSKYLLRVTADCPLVSPTLIDSMYEQLIQNDLDFLSNSHQQGIIKGFDLEFINRDLLLSIDDSVLDSYELEHVTPCFYHMSGIRKTLLEYPELANFRHLNFSLDTVADYVFLTNLENEYEITGMSFEEIWTKLIFPKKI